MNGKLTPLERDLLAALREIDRLASKVGRDSIVTVARIAIAKAEGHLP